MADRPIRRTKRRGLRADDIFGRVAALARNLWWSWNTEPQRLFAALDPVLWEATNHNPLECLAQLSSDRRAELLHDDTFIDQLANCEDELERYLRAETWFRRGAGSRPKRLQVAYFCAEFGLHECLPLYAGGLGILAGDHLKSASDLGVPLVGIGLLYRCGYYQQALDRSGATQASFPEYDFTRLPISDIRQKIAIPLGHRRLRARIWNVQVGRVPLYLLDTDLPENTPRQRAITRALYGGDNQTRLQQEIILGIGGVVALEKLGIRPTVYHLNEGHAAFCALERLRRYRASGLSLSKAKERVRCSTVFTTHTPVPAGHDRFAPALAWRYLGPLAESAGLARRELLALGCEDSDDNREPFCMTVLALRLAARCNGVSKLHGEVSRRMWQHVYGVSRASEVPIGHVTNGVHCQTWLAPEMEPFYRRYLRPRWVGAKPRDDWWRRAGNIPPAELWRARGQLRRRLVHFVRQRLLEQISRRLGPLEDLVNAYETLDEDALTIGFARRFATYKRAPLIFRDPKRLAAILNNPRCPVQLIFAGKAHPQDAEGQQLAQKIHQYARRAGFAGRVVLLENYDMHVGRMLTSGCDVWLNNPLRPQEASGTSGMKPPLHGGLNCSILDGWWPEAYNRHNGWAIDVGQARRTRAAQNRADAEALYDLLEKEIVPLFYRRDSSGLPNRWIRRMVASMQTVCSRFSTHRMVAEYLRDYYLPS
ncbi:MAG: alpha-glucan family phosphorylase [Planctomycetota bacterium]